MERVLIAVAAVIAGICGAALGLLFTVAHRASVPVAGFDVPYGLVLGILAAAAFLVALRLLWDGRWTALGGAVGLVASILALSFGGAGGSAIVSDDASGWTWMIVPAVVAVIVVAWPRTLPRPRHGGPVASVVGDTIDGPEHPVEER